MTSKGTSSYSLQVILLVHVLTIASVILNVHIVRQVFGFLYLTFVPGFAILKILNLEERDVASVILFSSGLSIAFLMFTGLVINELYPLLGISAPLSAVPLSMTLIGVTLFLTFAAYRSNIARLVKTSTLGQITAKTLLTASLIVVPLVLSIFGTLYNMPTILLLMVAAVAILWALAVFSRKLIPTELYPLAILVTGLSLLLCTTLISKYNLGNDINGEFYTFKLTEIRGQWDAPGVVASPTQITNFQSDLSVTILPTIYSAVLNISGELIFKLIFAFILALLPLAIYRICSLQMGRQYAILSAFFFMSTPYSFLGVEPLAVERQIVAELFFVLSVLLIVDERKELGKRKMLFVVFSLALIVSHYSIAYIFLLYVVFTFIFSYRRGHKGVLGPLMVLFLVSTVFSWYVLVSDSPTLMLTDNIQRMYKSFLVDLLNPAARSSTVFNYLNPSTSSSIVGLAYRLLIYLQNFFIFVGILWLLVKRNVTSLVREYQYMSILSIVILIASLIVPRFAPVLNFTRFYGITLLFLAPFFALGGEAFFESVRKIGFFLLSKFGMIQRRNQKLNETRHITLKFVAVILIIAFLFEIGLVNRVTGSDPLSFSLDLDRRRTTTNLGLKISFYEVYTPEQDVFGARWYATYANQELPASADYTSRDNVLTAYALVDRWRISVPSDSTALVQVLRHNGYVYLRLLNVYYSMYVTESGPTNISSVSFMFNERNKIYTNGASEIYYTP